MKLNLADKFNFSSNFHGLTVIKNPQSIFLNMSQKFAEFFGWKSANECIKLTNYKTPFKAVELAEKFRYLDKKVIYFHKKMIKKLLYVAILQN